ncbi:cupin domain-containing protein [Ancylobacter sonchi]|uniref:cupin domain-containing protein n=1 Tax=Ancylobacter sonchi TaxID=1937790 RepID=UPI001BD21E22|nr:cupin domain-containing protein [Ancylobacter sonchi]MBS7533220.1 cupin domain-containing protein [Ancylobacter sonchi]
MTTPEEEANAFDEAPIRLGTQLRHARKVKSLRLKDVADRSGYSESLISKIENNKATPSLNTLHRIAKVLGTSVAALMNENPRRPDIVMGPQQRPIIQEIAFGGIRSDGTEAEVMIPFGASTMLEAFLVRVQPGGSSDGQRQHEGEEVGFVRQGQLLLTVAGTTYRLKEGDSFFFPSSQPHGFTNPGDIPAEIIWVNTPPTL